MIGPLACTYSISFLSIMASALNIAHPSHRTSHLCTQHADSPHPCSQHTSVHLHSSRLRIDQDLRKFDCNICLDVCRDPVVTMCGHLFCWPCLYYWFSLHSISKECPVCKADVQDKIVPLYGCGNLAYSTHSLSEKFHGIHIPCRPSATTSTASNASTSTASNASAITNHAIQYHAIHRISARYTMPTLDLGFYATLLRLGFGFLLCFLGRRVRNAAAILVRRGRFNNEKEFVLHWGFVLMALVAMGFFLL